MSGPGEGDAFLDPKYQPGQRRAAGAPARPGEKYASGSTSARPGMLLILLPWLMFMLNMSLFTYGYHHIPTLVVMTALLCGCFSLIFIFTSGSDTNDGRSAVILGLLCAFAIGIACLGGLNNYNSNMAPYWAYEESREYHNVLPSEPAAAHADAGKIFFADAARIDTTKAVGYRKGLTYCVAPILDPSSTTRVEFWAVGLDCCAERGDFQCGDAMAEGSNEARGGVVVMDDRFLSGGSHFEYFGKAVKEAEAANDLVSASEPIFLHWVKDPDAIQNGYFSRGSTEVVGLSILYFAANYGFAFAATYLRVLSANRSAKAGAAYGAA